MAWRRAPSGPSIYGTWSGGLLRGPNRRWCKWGSTKSTLGRSRSSSPWSATWKRKPVWFGRERKKETLDEFFETELSRRQRMRIMAVCVDMWEPFRLSLEQHVPKAKIVYDKFHVMQHANAAVDEVRRAEFFRKGGKMRDVVKGKRWLLLTRWINLTPGKRQQLNQLFAMNRRVFKAYQTATSKPYYAAVEATRTSGISSSKRSVWPQPEQNSWLSRKQLKMRVPSDSRAEPSLLRLS
jgi:hypothetical protein